MQHIRHDKVAGIKGGSGDFLSGIDARDGLAYGRHGSMCSGHDVDIWLVQLYNHLNLLNIVDVFPETGEFPDADNRADQVESSMADENEG
jgi:hypothetical protein